MVRSRSERRDRVRSDRRRLLLAVGLILGGVAVVGTAVALALTAPDVRDEATPAAVSAPTTESLAAADSLPVEVPDVRGEPLAQAEAVLELAGFAVERREVATAPVDPERTVLDQEPRPGTLAERGSQITLVHAPANRAAVSSPATPAEGFVVCIDPGHQQTSDQRPEPIGPGSSETKMRVTGGATGVATGRPEYRFTLEVSERIKKHLEAQGVRVIMTRATHDVSISNAERAKVANAAGADLFLRIHADGNTDRTMRGLSTLYPATNTWTKTIAAPSLSAARTVHAAVIKSTGAKDRGVVPRGDLSGFNWSQVPTCLVECGFMSNPDEDALLASPVYQEKLAVGIADGVMAYLRGR